MSFDRLAPYYRTMEACLAGELLQRCRTQWLSEVQGARNALLVGEGHGRMLAACGAALPDCCFTVLDQSAAMLREARRRWAHAGGSQRVTFQQADLREWRGRAGAFDLVITNFFFDCFQPDELSEIIARLNASMALGGHWLVADFCVPPTGWQRWRAHLVLKLAYTFFGMTTGISARQITSPDSALRRHGFVLERREHFNHGLLHADLWARSAGRCDPIKPEFEERRCEFVTVT